MFDITTFLKLLIPAALLFLTSCSGYEGKVDSGSLFDYDGFIKDQVSQLYQQQKGLKKKIILSGDVEEYRFTPDSVGWQNELSLFSSADIFKPGLFPFYEKASHDSLGYLIDHYALMDSSNLETKQMTIVSNMSSETIIKINVIQQVRNPIYGSKRNLTLWFMPGLNGTVEIDSFAVVGSQKIFSMDSTIYLSFGKIVQSN